MPSPSYNCDSESDSLGKKAFTCAENVSTLGNIKSNVFFINGLGLTQLFFCLNTVYKGKIEDSSFSNKMINSSFRIKSCTKSTISVRFIAQKQNTCKKSAPSCHIPFFSLFSQFSPTFVLLASRFINCSYDSGTGLTRMVTGLYLNNFR